MFIRGGVGWQYNDPTLANVQSTYPFVIFEISSHKHGIVRATGELLVVISVTVLKGLIPHVKSLRQLRRTKFSGDVCSLGTSLKLSPASDFTEKVVRCLVFWKFITVAQRYHDHCVVTVCRRTQGVKWEIIFISASLQREGSLTKSSEDFFPFKYFISFRDLFLRRCTKTKAVYYRRIEFTI